MKAIVILLAIVIVILLGIMKVKSECEGNVVGS